MPSIINGNGFNKNLSAFARSTQTKSNTELFNRYFSRGLNEEFNEDLFNELDTNENNYPMLYSLIGDNLSYLLTKLRKTLSPYIPTGYKLNAKSFAIDLETMLAENKTQVGLAVAQRKPNKYIVEMCSHLIEVALRGLGYTNNAGV